MLSLSYLYLFVVGSLDRLKQRVSTLACDAEEEDDVNLAKLFC